MIKKQQQQQHLLNNSQHKFTILKNNYFKNSFKITDVF
jgi:hypothetical protein